MSAVETVEVNTTYDAPMKSEVSLSELEIERPTRPQLMHAECADTEKDSWSTDFMRQIQEHLRNQNESEG
jgi:hypothetical protein